MILEKIMEIAQEVFDDNTLVPSSKLEAANGYDSMAHVQFIIELESQLNVNLEDDAILKDVTFEEVKEIIKRKS